MALVQCNVCSREISDRAAVCPQCGDPRRPAPWIDRAFKIVVGVAAALFIAMFVLGLILSIVVPKGPSELHLRDIDARTSLRVDGLPQTA